MKIVKKELSFCFFLHFCLTLQTNKEDYMKKLSIIILMWVAFLLPSHAVLKEANLDTTLFMLRTELTSYHLDFEKQNEYAKQQQQQIIKELMTIMAQADQNSIMLYSQRNGYIFDLTYACHEATEQFDKFKTKAAPFRGLINKNNIEVARFDSLINYLVRTYCCSGIASSVGIIPVLVIARKSQIHLSPLALGLLQAENICIQRVETFFKALADAGTNSIYIP